MAEISETRVNIAQQTPTTQTGVEELANLRGNRRNDTVIATSTTSKIQDMAEEIGMSTASRASKRDLGERVEKRGAGTDFDAIARVLRHLEKLPDMPEEERLKELVDTLRQFEELLGGWGSAEGSVTAEDILEALRNYDPDVTHQDAALDSAIAYFQDVSPSEEFVELLRQAKEAFESPRIRQDVLAGYAAAKSASETGRSLGLDPHALREEYRALLRSEPSVSALYARLGPLVDSVPGERGQMDKIDMVIDSLMQAAGRDLEQAEGKGSIGDPVHLAEVKAELQGLKKMRSVIETIGGAFDNVLQMRPELAATEGVPDRTGFVSRALEFVSAERGGGFNLAQGIVAGFDKAGAEVPVLVANQLRQAFTEAPDSVMNHRLEKNAALMALLDKLVAAEEAAFAAQAGG